MQLNTMILSLLSWNFKQYSKNSDSLDLDQMLRIYYKQELISQNIRYKVCFVKIVREL